MKEGIFPCENCSKTFTHQHKLNSHIILDHQKTELKFYCDICQKSNFQTGQTKGFPQRVELDNHIKINHVKLTEPKACTTCGEEFSFGADLKAGHCRKSTFRPNLFICFEIVAMKSPCLPFLAS